jgi:hypothetical protein
MIRSPKPGGTFSDGSLKDVDSCRARRLHFAGGTRRVMRCTPAARLLVPIAYCAMASSNVGAQSLPTQVTNVQAAPSTDAQASGLLWSGSVTLDGQRTEVNSGSGALGTPLSTGGFGSAAVQGDLRLVSPDAAIDYLMFRTVHGNDPAMLPRDHFQVRNLQFGRTASYYSVSGGDVVPGFSRLSSALGLRGIQGQFNARGIGVQGYAGRVQESWEALATERLRTQPTRAVRGAKIEATLAEGLRAFVTGQQYTEHGLAVGNGEAEANAVSRNGTLGVQYSGQRLALAAEFGLSRLHENARVHRSGDAALVEGSWRFDEGTLRFGAHGVDAGYTSLALTSVPGVKEAYLGADWAPAPSILLGADLRRARFTSSGGELGGPSFDVNTVSGSLSATASLAADLPGWSIGLQQSGSRSTAADDQRQANRARSVAFSYQSPNWNLNLTRTRSRVENSSYPDGDSSTDEWAWVVRRSSALSAGMASAIGLTAKTQVQRLASGQRADSNDAGLQFMLERSGLVGISLTISGGAIAPDANEPAVRTRGVQLDLTFPLNAQNQLRFYARHATRRGPDPAQNLAERSVGAQLSSSF